MSVANYSPSAQITMTPAAIEHTRKQLAKETAGGLRLAVKKSGCSGWKYDVSVAEQADPEDTVVKITDEVSVFIDKESLPFFQGTEIDFVQKGLNATLEFRNPNVADECGCGESFSITPDS